MNKKPIFIIPGFRHKPTDKAYRQLAKLLRQEGFRPIPVKIPWKQSTISENTEYFLKQYRKIEAKEKYILGFSFGAMIAFLASTKVSTAGLILCSLSPYFKEDLLKSKPKISSITWKRYKDFSTMHSLILAKQIKAKQIFMLYGTEEEKSVIKRVTKTYKQITARQKYLIPVLQTEHKIGDKNYLNSIHLAARVFN